MKAKKTEFGPRTRSRANAPPGVEKKFAKSSTASEKAVSSSVCPPPVKPTCVKIFRESSNGEPAAGTVAAYLALRNRQTNNVAAPVIENVESDQIEENADDQEVEEGNTYLSICLNGWFVY